MNPFDGNSLSKRDHYLGRMFHFRAEADRASGEDRDHCLTAASVYLHLAFCPLSHSKRQRGEKCHWPRGNGKNVP